MDKHNLSISNFKKEIKLISKVILLFLVIMLFFYNVSEQFTQGYCAALGDKIGRLRNVEGSKIVLLGNSNVSFGVDSEILETELEMPVVNMGLHGGLGNVFHEEMARINVKEGDIYVLCHNSFADNDTIEDPTLAWTTIENHVTFYELLRWKDIIPMIKVYPTYLKKCLTRICEGNSTPETGSMYSRSAFNEYGDVAYERSGSNYEFVDFVTPSGIGDVTIERINKLAAWLEERGATLVVAGYPIGNGELTANKEEFIKFQQDLEDQLECEVISDYTDYMYDYSYFYDTNLHLNDEGVELRTRQLVEDLRGWKERFGY